MRFSVSASGAYNIKRAMETADQRGVQWGSFGPPAAMKADVWFNTFTKQQQDAAGFSLKVNPDNLLLRDVGQSLGHTRISTRSAVSESESEARHCAAAVLPSQMMMVFAPDQPFRLLLGREALVLQGFPSQDTSLSELIENTSEALMADLAGNMVSTPIMLTMAMAAISSVSWRERPRAQASPTKARSDSSWTLFQAITSKPAVAVEEHFPKRQRQ